MFDSLQNFDFIVMILVYPTASDQYIWGGLLFIYQGHLIFGTMWTLAFDVQLDLFIPRINSLMISL